MNFTNRLMDENNPLNKLSSVICGISVSPLIIILLIDLLMDKGCKKNYSLHFISISINITDIKIIFHSIGDFLFVGGFDI
jgi:hypothetical protein